MVKVILAGWESGLSKVTLNKLLQQYCGMTLAGAKGAVDSLLEGNPVDCEIEGMDVANEFADKARALGTIVQDPVCGVRESDWSKGT